MFFFVFMGIDTRHCPGPVVRMVWPMVGPVRPSEASETSGIFLIVYPWTWIGFFFYLASATYYLERTSDYLAHASYYLALGGKFRTGTDPPLEVGSGPHYW